MLKLTTSMDFRVSSAGREAARFHVKICLLTLCRGKPTIMAASSRTNVAEVVFGNDSRRPVVFRSLRLHLDILWSVHPLRTQDNIRNGREAIKKTYLEAAL